MTRQTGKYPLKVGVQIQPQHVTYPQYADAVRRIEDLGVDSIWNWDHFFPLSGDPQGSNYEGWTLLSAMATLTTRAQVGCLVTCNGYRSAALISNMAKTVDHISNGRLILGIGAGWNQRDYDEFGYEFGTAGSRLASLEESLPIIKQHWEVDIPKPINGTIPILIGGGGEKKTLRLAAKYADIWHGFGNAETLAHKVQVLNDWCAKEGRDPNEIERSAGTNIEDTDEIRDSYVKAGTTHLIVGMTYPFDYDAVKKLVSWRDSRQGQL
ncbi:MAG TPA: LLM class F420-dependent oxidoreductase [Dictyobacter sp.]|nr:LLM class F420-dependent oxidoreductase [Dictyobacter sp.]